MSQEIISNEHYEFLQLSQVGRISDRAQKVVDAEEQSLRQFNAELLTKIGEFRKKNLELAANENELRTKLAVQAKQNADKEREITAKLQGEIDQLKAKLEAIERANEETKEEWSRKLSKLSDESWAQGLENENLKRMEEELESKLQGFQGELDRQRELEDAHKQAIQTLTNENHRISQELQEAEQNKIDTQKAFDSQNIQLAKMVEATQEREAQLVRAYEALRVEYANMDRCYNESNNALVKLQSEMRERYQQHENELQELTTYLETKAAQESQLIREENANLKQALMIKDTRNEEDRRNLQAWKDQLTSLDQYLKQFGDKLKKSKSEMIRLSRSLEDEVRFSVAHPFTEYLEIADQEVAQIEQQLTTTSSLSPLKQKLDQRLQAAVSHRDGIKQILNKSGSQLEEHTKSIRTLIKSLEFLT